MGVANGYVTPSRGHRHGELSDNPTRVEHGTTKGILVLWPQVTVNTLRRGGTVAKHDDWRILPQVYYDQPTELVTGG